MIAANYSEFRSGLKSYLDKVEEANETLIMSWSWIFKGRHLKGKVNRNL